MIIDNVILKETKIKNNDLDGLNFIDKIDFEKDLAQIWQYRDQSKLTKDKPIDY